MNPRQRKIQYDNLAYNITSFWTNNKELILKNNTYAFHITNVTPEQKINFENLIFEYFNNYHSNFRCNAFCKSKYERSRISVPIVEYCEDVRGRWIELEPNLIKDYVFAVDYISSVVKDRVLEYEDILETKGSVKHILSYSKAINKKLPEKLHNIMIAHAIAGSRYAKTYFNLLEKKN